jgi:hypothetical protein
MAEGGTATEQGVTHVPGECNPDGRSPDPRRVGAIDAESLPCFVASGPNKGVVTGCPTVAPTDCAMFTNDKATFAASAQSPSGIQAGGQPTS